ncbi:DUF262 domain-containing protein [Candidatus Venteria ishoeyi]|uniref:DUF262 domain-containing protein n=1 Tax=Candidatus Venteria ishoeyi TaxID=1899563 RepID=A0A1H6F9W7_9GAMM|nr:DUF262 domain-containing protein [Candidatus Venteria ishoeyi]SEH06887.1 Uncharacterised protein [Candidatus Venteria ishoeyi]
MEAKECKIQDILTENKRYVIPAYQRPYSWGKDHAEQLIDDIYQSFCSEEDEYFIGSIICIKNDSGNIFEVVDGQQRLTTLSLVVSQLKILINHQGVQDDLQKRILPIDVYSGEPAEPRLSVRKKEKNLYNHYILQGNSSYIPQKPTTTEALFLDNHKIIGSYLCGKDENELKSLAKYIFQNVYVVFVQTDNFTSSFRLFNVLNNRGLPLSNADLLKNALFEAASSNSSQSIQVEECWDEIESMVGSYKLDKFLKLHKISEKKDRDRVVQVGLDGFITSLKDEFNSNAVNMSLSLRGSAKNYTKIIENDFNDLKVKRCISSMLSLTNDEWIPVFMSYLNRVDSKNDLPLELFQDFVTLFEKVYMQGWIKRLVKSKREMVCYSSLVAINNGLSLTEIYDYIKSHADNLGFIKALDEDLYEPQRNQVNLIKTILLRLDIEQQDDSVLKTYTGRITIEHILPQKISHDYWENRYTIEEHDHWLHKIGNLTLISGTKNSEAQNSDFPRKKKIYDKLNNKSSFDLTKDLCFIDNWDVEQLKMRQKQLTDRLVKLWAV